MRTCGCVVVLVIALSSAPRAETSSSISIAPYVGIVSESDVVGGTVRFSDGSTDFIAIEPDAGLMLGVELGLVLRPRWTGLLALSYTTADAEYIEDGDPRLDVGVSAFRIQPGVVIGLLESGTLELGAGGGLTVGRMWIEDIFWNDQRIEPSSTLFGLFGTLALDVAISERMAFHTHLVLEVNRPSYGDLESELARADGETSARVDHDLRTAVMLAVGVAFAL